jgi:chaperonin GroES
LSLPAWAFARADAVIGANKAGPAFILFNFTPYKEVTCMKIKPMNDRILVVRVEEEQKSPGGIIIPDTAKEKPQEGKVISAGPGKLDDDGKRIPLAVKPGDRILFSKYAGTEIKIDGVDHIFMREDDILGILQ